MKGLCIYLTILLSLGLNAQNYVDTLYQVESESDLVYGVDTGFAGRLDTLRLDLCFPSNAPDLKCGRPLMLIIHGGAWAAGDKDEGYVARLKRDFAKRGFVTASINYRLGFFNTEKNVDCILDGWKCFNAADSSEWYRANFRGIQDANGALRFLVNRSEHFNINPDQIFIVGESAGAFIAMGVGFLDDSSEIKIHFTKEKPPVLPPHQIYEDPCIRKLNLAEDIDSLILERPDLGPFIGKLNLSVDRNFVIRGVGAFYGGAFNNIFKSHRPSSPALYLYHQPCDLIVPYGSARLLAGYNECAMGFPTYCQNIIQRPMVYGSRAIVEMIDTLKNRGVATSEYFFDQSQNRYNCAQQVLDPSLGCHAMDNYWLRTTNMARYFAPLIDSCFTVGQNEWSGLGNVIRVFPNPASEKLIIDLEKDDPILQISILNILGEEEFKFSGRNQTHMEINLGPLGKGHYFVVVESVGGRRVQKLVKR